MKKQRLKKLGAVVAACALTAGLIFVACGKKEKIIAQNVSTSKNVAMRVSWSNGMDINSVEIPPNEVIAITVNINSESHFCFENKGNSTVLATLNSNSDFANALEILTNDTAIVSASQINYESNSNTLFIKNNGTVATEIVYTVIQDDYELIGFLHNEMLSIIGQSASFSDLTEEDKFNIINNGLQRFMDYTPSTISFSTANEVLNGINSHSINYPNFLYSQEQLTFNEKESLNSLISIMVNTNGNPELLIQQVRNLEDSISNSGLSNTEKKILLGSCAVARYSSVFWDNARNDSSNAWYTIANNVPTNPTDPSEKFNWGRLIADAVGFAVGDILAGGFGPQAVLAGAAVGTLASSCA